MKKMHLIVATSIVAVVALGAATVAAANGNRRHFDEHLTGYEEVPALSTAGNGTFSAAIDKHKQEIRYRLTFSSLETSVTQAHIHFENRTNSGNIVVFLCTNIGNGPVGTQLCPATGGTISGTIRPADVGAGAAAEGIAAGEFDELVRAMRAGSTYVNVHSTGHPGGEIRAQLEDSHSHH